ncbi:MAG: hypothetical protein M3500_00285 [Actinomycetota bacterium]|nr:hypothetical protein [Actinomycetota bacterium]
MTQLGDVADPHEDVLDSGTPDRPVRWIAAAVVAVLALIGWNVMGSDSEQALDRVVESHAAEPPGVGEPIPDVSPSTDHAEQLTFVDDQHGFIVQSTCAQAPGGVPCPRRILATTDGGSSWQSRGPLPSYAQTAYLLVAESERDLTVLDVSLASVVRSVDGGRSWRQLPITRADPAAAPAGALLVHDVGRRCSTDCPGSLVWIDPATEELHPLPSQPWAGAHRDRSTLSTAWDGDIVAAAAGTAGLVSMSGDGGQTWIDTRLEVPLAKGQRIQQSQAMAAGGGRAYAFMQVFGGLGMEATYGFRTDDAGVTWTDLRFEDQQVWIPAGVIGGELISTDLPGRIFLSSAAGTRWAEAGTVAGGPWLSQTAPDGAVLATVFNYRGEESYHLSTDGRTWTPLTLPDV